MILEIRKHPARVPVIYGKTALMPMTWKRAKQFHESKKGVLKKNEFGMFYLSLKKKPSGFNTQNIVVGFDPGSKFDGFSVVSQKCHLLNMEIIHQIDGCNLQKKRAKGKHNAYDNNVLRKFVLIRLLNFFPIKLLSLEDDSFARTGKSLAVSNIVDDTFYDYLHLRRLKFCACVGQQTHCDRVNLFGCDLKTRNKNGRSFFPHCLDAFAIASRYLGVAIHKLHDCQSEVIFIQRNHDTVESDKGMGRNLFSSFSIADRRMVRSSDDGGGKKDIARLQQRWRRVS